ncbi:MAG: histidine phosphatase family protein [Pseudomonadota bacterium]
MITLLIARHGNTFDPGDILLRVGKQTDLPLSNSGREQAKKLGVFLHENHPKIDRVFVSSLKRTQETAAIAWPENVFEINPIFDEVDYGIDDGKPENEVVARIGEIALKRWEEHGIAPADWKVNAEKIKQDWKDFANQCIAKYPDGITILVVTSNGIARFAPAILANPCDLPKMKTGAISAFQFTTEQHWQLNYWNNAPV